MYTYVRVESNWVFESTLVASNATGGQFGFDVCLDGDTLAATAFSTGRSISVYTHDGTGWGREVQLEPVHPSCGLNVALNGNTLIYGCFAEGAGGVAHVYERTEIGWVESSELAPTGPEAESQVGYTVDLHGDRAVVGSYCASHTYVFRRLGGIWSSGERLSGYTLENDCVIQVAIDDDSVVVGALSSSDGMAASNLGYAVVYTCSAAESLTWNDLIPTQSVGALNRTISREWRAIDTCGNTSIDTQRIEVLCDTDNDRWSDDCEESIVDADPNDDVETVDHVFPEADFDGDGATNREECEAGTDPVDPTDSPSFIGFRLATTRAAEPNAPGILSNVIIRVDLSPATTVPVSATIGLRQSSAVESNDYLRTLPLGLNIAPGETAASFSIQILADEILEGDEVLELTLEPITSGILTGRTRHGLIIENTRNPARREAHLWDCHSRSAVAGSPMGRPRTMPYGCALPAWAIRTHCLTVVQELEEDCASGVRQDACRERV
ncbi:MAG: thrombospondin type 3 repeat-containing protein, partial [Verrucomicrobiota bacterium]